MGTAVPLGALLPPGSSQPAAALPSPSFALLGPLPPTTPVHLALNYIALTELPEYQHLKDTRDESVRVKKQVETERAMIITGRKSDWTEEILEEDEDWLRVHGGEHGVLHKLKRVDIRACPTVDHLRLLLTLLGSTETSSSDETKVVNLPDPPGVIILWDLARMFMEQVEEDENIPPGEDRPENVGDWRFKQGIALSDYMDVISTAKAVREHFSSLRPRSSPTQLIILEPHLDRLSSLPILKPASELRKGLATPTRERRVSIKHGTEWLFGKAVGFIEQEDTSDVGETTYRLLLPDDEAVYRAKRLPCPHDPHANPRLPKHRGLGEDTAEDGGRRWEWIEQYLS